jgi:hypothetical protein
MSKRGVGTALTAVVSAAVVPLIVLQVTAAGASAVRHQQAQPQTINIEGWYDINPTANVLSGTLSECYEVDGIVQVEGGGPTWSSDTSYNAPDTVSSGGATVASHECASPVPGGGFIMTPPPEPGQFPLATYTASSGSPGGLTTIYSNHTIFSSKGEIFLSSTGAYNMTANTIVFKLSDGPTVQVAPYTTAPGGSFVITGGTGAYAGLRGSGTCTSNATTFPWVKTIEQGTAWFN